MNPSSRPLSLENILAGIIVTVVGGVILAFIIQDARFSPKSNPVQVTETAIVQGETPIVIDGELVHTSDSKLVWIPANVNLRDFVADVTFFNPYDGSENQWSYGIIFRHAGYNQQFRFYVTSFQTWNLVLASDVSGELLTTSVASGQVNNLNISANGSNHLRIIVVGETGYLIINNVYISTFPTSGKMTSGDIGVTTEFVGDQTIGKSTTFRDFSILPIDKK